MTKQTTEKKPLQWHPAFYASIQIELADEADKLIFENEHTLGTKPMLIDVLVIKKDSDYEVKKNIGRIFRNHNIVEYKSPEDYLSIDDFYKVYGYTCFYKSSATTVDEITVDDLTITFVCKNKPKKLLEHLIIKRQLVIKQESEGIYYIIGDIIPMQLIVTSELTPANNLWLNSLTDDLKGNDIIGQLSREYGKHKKSELYKSVMNIIVRANNEQFEKEARNMCEALLELFKDDIDAAENKGRYEGRLEGRHEGMLEGIKATINACKSLGTSKEKALEMITENFNFNGDEAEKYIELYW